MRKLLEKRARGKKAKRHNMIEQEIFRPENWKQLIVESLDKKYVCNNCGREIMGNKLGEHLYCENCQRYCWVKK